MAFLEANADGRLPVGASERVHAAVGSVLWPRPPVAQLRPRIAGAQSLQELLSCPRGQQWHVGAIAQSKAEVAGRAAN